MFHRKPGWDCRWTTIFGSSVSAMGIRLSVAFARDRRREQTFAFIPEEIAQFRLALFRRPCFAGPVSPGPCFAR